jgi:hypothetical protein
MVLNMGKTDFQANALQCSCGGKLVPTYMQQIVRDKGDDFEQIIRAEWKCEKCGKVVKR